MIKICRKNITEPSKLSAEGKIERVSNEKKYDEGQRDFSFESSIYGNREEVKSVLKKTQHNKCAFCESVLVSVAHGDVEHFRPKGDWKQHLNQKELIKPGYYWLAYEWENLLFSCQICNQSYKKNYFPLKDPDNRALSHHMDIQNEERLLINPLIDDPEKHITFNQHIIQEITIEGKKTIEVCGIDRPDLNLERERVYSDIPILLNIIEEYNATKDQLVKDSLQSIAERAKINLSKKCAPSSPFSLMVKCAIKNSGIDLS